MAICVVSDVRINRKSYNYSCAFILLINTYDKMLINKKVSNNKKCHEIHNIYLSIGIYYIYEIILSKRNGPILFNHC